MNLILATRKSKLAQKQTETIIAMLKEKQKIDAKKLLVVTEGDKRLDVTLDKIGGKGLFVKEIELALLEGKAQGDVFVSRDGISLKNLRKGAIIGTSSIRRAAQLRKIRSDLNIVPIRGNVGTRLEKMKNEGMDGIILAAAGLKRLGMEDIITEYLDPKVFIPAVGQGALGIECLTNSESKEYFKA